MWKRGTEDKKNGNNGNGGERKVDLLAVYEIEKEMGLAVLRENEEDCIEQGLSSISLGSGGRLVGLLKIRFEADVCFDKLQDTSKFTKAYTREDRRLRAGHLQVRVQDKALPPSSKPAKSRGGKQKMKKWSKGKQKEKVNNMVFFDKATYDKVLFEAPKSIHSTNLIFFFFFFFFFCSYNRKTDITFDRTVGFG
ncbi:hypothetical protein LguiA_001272 [Lonicera macranthoides]